MSNIPQWSCEKFAAETFSSAPVPGGGGVAALVGSIGAALAGMGYGLPSSTEEEKAVKEEKMQAALKVAVTAPIEIVRLAYEAILLHEELAVKGSKLAVSDVGCGVLCLKAAMQCGWLNVMINLKSIHDAEFIAGVEKELKPILETGEKLADEIYANVAAQLAY